MGALPGACISWNLAPRLTHFIPDWWDEGGWAAQWFSHVVRSWSIAGFA